MVPKHSKQAEFDSWSSYRDFARLVKQSRRFVWNDDIRSFLDTVAATNKNRDSTINAGSIWCRAQIGIEVETDDNKGFLGHIGLPAERMRPLPNGARGGRANSAGIPVLYLASEVETAISEVRPWIGSEISVARFRITRDLKAINLSVKYGKSLLNYLTFGQLAGDAKIDAKTKADVVWSDIDNAFSLPVSLDENSADYVPTQILSELFLSLGYDAVAYRSQFGEDGYNLALFDINDADIIDCTPYAVSSIEIKSSQIGNAWHRRSARAERTIDGDTEGDVGK